MLNCEIMLNIDIEIYLCNNVQKVFEILEGMVGFLNFFVIFILVLKLFNEIEYYRFVLLCFIC